MSLLDVNKSIENFTHLAKEQTETTFKCQSLQQIFELIFD
jgi:hypothetical protein